MEGKIVYFEKQGKQNTDRVLRIAKKRADELGINTILVSSTWGYTALKAVESIAISFSYLVLLFKGSTFTVKLSPVTSAP